jgi:hypothetical protein
MRWRMAWFAWTSTQHRSRWSVSCFRFISEFKKLAMLSALAAIRSPEKSRKLFAVLPASSLRKLKMWNFKKWPMSDHT